MSDERLTPEEVKAYFDDLLKKFSDHVDAAQRDGAEQVRQEALDFMGSNPGYSDYIDVGKFRQLNQKLKTLPDKLNADGIGDQGDESEQSPDDQDLNGKKIELQRLEENIRSVDFWMKKNFANVEDETILIAKKEEIAQIIRQIEAQLATLNQLKKMSEETRRIIGLTLDKIEPELAKNRLEGYIGEILTKIEKKSLKEEEQFHRYETSILLSHTQRALGNVFAAIRKFENANREISADEREKIIDGSTKAYESMGALIDELTNVLTRVTDVDEKREIEADLKKARLLQSAADQLVSQLEHIRQRALEERENDESEKENEWDKLKFWNEFDQTEVKQPGDALPLVENLASIQQAIELRSDLIDRHLAQEKEQELEYLKKASHLIRAIFRQMSVWEKSSWAASDRDNYEQLRESLVGTLEGFESKIDRIENESKEAGDEEVENDDPEEEQPEGPPEEPPEDPPEPPENSPEEDDHLVRRIEEELSQLEAELPLFLFDTRSDQISDELEELYDQIKKIENSDTRNELEKRIWKLEYRLRRKSVIHQIETIEKLNQNPSNFGSVQSNPIDSRGFNVMKRLSTKISEPEFQADVSGISEWYGVVKGIHFAWSQIGNSVLGVEGGERGVTRQFPSNFDKEHVGEINGKLINSLLRKTYGHPEVGRVINEKVETRRVKIKNKFVDAEGSSVVSGRNQLEMSVQTHASAWVMRKLYDVYRNKAEFKYLDEDDDGQGTPAQISARARSFEPGDINAQNVHAKFDELIKILHGAASYEYYTGQISKEIDFTHILRVARLFTIGIYPPASIAEQPTFLTDEMYKMFHWHTYLYRDIGGNYAKQTPLFFSLVMQPGGFKLPQLEVFLANGNKKKFIRFINEKFRYSNPSKIAAKGTKINTEEVEVEYEVDGNQFKKDIATVNVETTGPAAFLFNHSQIIMGADNLTMLTPMQTVPLRHNPVTGARLEKPLRIKSGEGAPKINDLQESPTLATIDDLKDRDGVPVFELWNFDEDPQNLWNLFSYYFGVSNNASGFYRELLLAPASKFIERGMNYEDYADVFKFIKYGLEVMPAAGQIKRFGSEEEDKKKEVQRQMENRLRFLFLLSVIILQMTKDDSPWKSKLDAKLFVKNVFNENPDFILRSGESDGSREGLSKRIVNYFLGEPMDEQFTNEMAVEILEDVIEHFYGPRRLATEVVGQILDNMAAKFLRH